MSMRADAIRESLRFKGTDLEIRARLADAALTIDVMKAGTLVHRVVLDQATDPIEHAWLIDLFAREERVGMRELAHQADDYLGSSNRSHGG